MNENQIAKEVVDAAMKVDEALKTHKKGLVQQLFPCPEETT